MNVQLSNRGIGHSAPTGAGKTTSVGTVAADTANRTSTSNNRRKTTAAWHSTFAAQQEHINRQVTHAQRAITFLDQTTASLQELKNALSGSVARRPAAQAALETSLARVQAQWQTRHVATGGALGPDLSFHDDGGALQSFRIRALDMDALQSERAETLTVYPRGPGKTSISLPFDGRYRSEREWARRIDHAFAPTGISAAVTDERELSFTTPESRWPELREQMMIQGNGHRFPAGRPSRATAEAIPPTIDPTAWRIGDATQQRSTLRNVVQAIDQINDARAALHHITVQASAALRADSSMLTGDEAEQIAGTFDATLEQTGDFRRFATIGAALRGLNGQRVLSVAG